MTQFRLLPLLMIAACLSQPAFAQINPFRGTRATPLTAEDITALTDATNQLLDRHGLAAGAKETWSNPRSGAKGTVTAGNATKRKGLACRVMRYDVTVPGPRSERNRTLTWCKTQDGWKLAS
jgi:surface antigen